MKKYFKPFFAFLVFLSFLFVTTIKTNSADVAPEEIDVCKPEELVYAKAVKIWDLDIRRTVDNFITSQFISLFANLAGVPPDAVMGCQNYLFSILVAALNGDTDFAKDINELDMDCKGTDSEVCAELVADIDGSAALSYTNSVEVMAVRSSFLGFTNLVEGAVRKEPLPVNLAYYWNQSISKVPYFNKALAAPGDAYENLPMVKAAYGLWVLTTRVALGIMSAVLLYTGITIILRKRINSQLVVSVQYAIPKLVISIFFIIFSYPIGATIASISWGLFRGAFPLVFNTLLQLEAGKDFPSGILFLLIIISTLRLAQGGYFYVFLIVMVAVLLLLLKLIIYFKALLIYIKMIFSIMTAPLEFALGAVPGSENRMKDWFLRMAKYGLTIFAMGVVIPLTLVFGLSVLLSYSFGMGEVGGWGIVIGLLTPIIVVMFGFGIGINMEKHIDGLFGTDKKRR